MRIEQKEKVSIVSLFAVATLVVIILHYCLPAKKVCHGADDFHVLLTERILDAIEARLDGPILVSKAMANNAHVRDLLKREESYSVDYVSRWMEQWLESIRASGDYATAFLVSEKTHRYYSADGLYKIINPAADSTDVWYSDFLSMNIPFALDVDVDLQYGGKWTIFQNVRVEDESGELLGVCGVGVIVYDLQELFRQYERDYQVKINLVDKNGLVQIDTSSINLEMEYRSGENFSVSEEYVYVKRNNGFLVSCYVKNLDWYLVVQNKPHTHEKDTFLFSFVFVMIALFVLACALLVLLEKFFAEERRKISAGQQVDALTGLYNRNYFKDVYGERGIFNTTRYKSIAVFDIDFFKEANDRLNGDLVLLQVADCAKVIFGEQNEIFRWGGDEFAVLMTQSLNAAYDVCRDFCVEVEKKKLVTVSVGVTEVRLSDTVKKNYYRAAQGCYLVKEMGGNGVKRS